MCTAPPIYNNLNAFKWWSLAYEDMADPRTQNWLLVSSFKPIFIWVFIYLLAAIYSPRFIKGSRPLTLHRVIIIYNIIMVSLNLHIFKELVVNAWRLKYNYWCQPCRIIHSQHEMELAAAIWWFFFSKLLEFCDTLIFILRHKWNQLTLLHIYHHSTMFPLWWIAIKWVPTGSTFFPALINSLVHVIMYSYYALSACGTAFKKHLWWKKYLTALQLLQFTTGLLWALQAIATQCDFPLWVNCATIIYMTTFLILFGRFYRQKYSALMQQPQTKSMI